MTEEQITRLRMTCRELVDEYGTEVSLVALAGYASARAGTVYEVVECVPLKDADDAEEPVTFQ